MSEQQQTAGSRACRAAVEQWKMSAGTERVLDVRWLVTAAEPPREYVRLTEVAGVISDVRQIPDSEQQSAAPLMLFPPMVNAHTHLEFSGLTEPLGPRDSFPGWIGSVLQHRNRPQRDAASEISSGLRECERGCLHTIGEIVTAAEISQYAESNVLQKVMFQEVIGLSAARIEEQYKMAATRVQQIRASGRQDLIAGLSPHASYTVHPELLQKLTSLSTEYGLPMAMHLAETRAEMQLLEYGSGELAEMLQRMDLFSAKLFPGGRTIRELLEIIAAAPQALVVHGNYLGQSELNFLQQQPQMTVVYCPRTHAWFRHAVYPLQMMLTAGIRVILGTDSRASNPDLDLLRELALVLQQNKWLKTEDAVSMISEQAAVALGGRTCVTDFSAGSAALGTLLGVEGDDLSPRQLLANGAVSAVSRLDH